MWPFKRAKKIKLLGGGCILQKEVVTINNKDYISFDLRYWELDYTDNTAYRCDLDLNKTDEAYTIKKLRFIE